MVNNTRQTAEELSPERGVEQRLALQEATDLANALWRRHYASDAPDWKALPDIRGVISQIDNMTTGLSRQPTASDDDWRTMESAPKNRVILLAAEFDGPGDWRVKCGGWRDDGRWEVWGASWTPTMWREMPPLPFATQAKAQEPSTTDDVISTAQRLAKRMGGTFVLNEAQEPVIDCPLCDGTGHKDHAGFAMDTCDHKGGE